MLQINNIYKTFNAGTVNEKMALKGLSLTLEDGDFVTVIGGNSVGKSTMLNAIAGVWQLDSGSIMIDGADVTKLPEYKRAQFLGRVFQEPMTGTAAKVLETMDMIVNRDQLTTLMITHNMKDAIAHGNRLIMMMDGNIILDIRGEEKKQLTVADLLRKFEEASGEEFAIDKAILG